MKLIYIQVSYDTAIALPLEALEYVHHIQLLKTEGYSTGANPITHPETELTLKFIDSSSINAKIRKERELREAKEDLEQMQRRVDSLQD